MSEPHPVAALLSVAATFPVAWHCARIFFEVDRRRGLVYVAGLRGGSELSALYVGLAAVLMVVAVANWRL